MHKMGRHNTGVQPAVFLLPPVSLHHVGDAGQIHSANISISCQNFVSGLFKVEKYTGERVMKFKAGVKARILLFRVCLSLRPLGSWTPVAFAFAAVAASYVSSGQVHTGARICMFLMERTICVATFSIKTLK